MIAANILLISCLNKASISYENISSNSETKENQSNSLVKVCEWIDSKCVLFIKLVAIGSCNCILSLSRTLEFQEAVS